MSKKIVLITECFFPESNTTSYYLTRIAKALAEENELKIICASELQDNVELSFAKNKIIRLSQIKLNKNKPLTRILKFLILSFRMFWSALKNVKRNDIVLGRNKSGSNVNSYGCFSQN